MNGRKTKHQLQRLLFTTATTVFWFYLPWNSGYGIYQYFSCILAWNSKTEVRNCGWMNGRKTNHQLQRLLLTAATTVFVFFAHQKFPLREKIILLLQFDAFFFFASVYLSAWSCILEPSMSNVSRISNHNNSWKKNTKQIIFSNFSCMFLHPNIFFQFEF